jgi:hypothetical protein
MIDTKAVRALAERTWEDVTRFTLRQCADRIDALEGQALSSIEREEYFAMKEDAERGRYVIDALSCNALNYYELEGQAVDDIIRDIDRARKGAT